MNLLKAFLVSTNSPWVAGTFITDKAEDFEEWASVILNEGPWEVGDWNGQQVGVEIAINIVDSV